MKKQIKILLVVTAALFMNTCTMFDDTPWVSLFDGKTLHGWYRVNGHAEYEVSNGEIVAKALRNSINTFLCTDSVYSDFILELEFKADAKINSGIQFRSQSYPEYKNGRVHGYQCELDPSDRKWTAGIYDEARRGWLHPVDNNTSAQNAYKHLQWNKIRIEAIADTIKTFVNGIPVSHLIDDMDREGFIALQTHGIGQNRELQGKSLRWKNIRIITKNPQLYSTPTPIPAKELRNKLSLGEKQDKWKLLFDGKTNKGWRGAKLNKFPKKGWTIENGMLTIHESGGGESEKAGDIVTVDKYKNFILAVDFKITPGANSGIKYFVDTELNQGKGSSIGLEYQILDDQRHPDALKGNHIGSRTLGSLYDLIEAQNKYPNPIGQWNHAMIISKDNHVEHWLNGRKLLTFERKSDNYRQLVAESKYKVWKDFGEADTGHILLQDHGNTVSFRNIKIKEL
ncbi:DUF1080 domain-containing protein [Puteibacter caeruleilacunae]|nr:DUF1080 domain-containing protein [Puteibacter caeruleilacunae]